MISIKSYIRKMDISSSILKRYSKGTIGTRKKDTLNGLKITELGNRSYFGQLKITENSVSILSKMNSGKNSYRSKQLLDRRTILVISI